MRPPEPGELASAPVLIPTINPISQIACCIRKYRPYLFIQIFDSGFFYFKVGVIKIALCQVQSPAHLNLHKGHTLPTIAPGYVTAVKRHIHRRNRRRVNL